MSNNIEVPESLKPLTDHMVQYDPEKHGRVERALIFIDTEAVSRMYIGNHPKGGVFIWKPGANKIVSITDNGHDWSFDRGDARQYADHVLIFEVQDDEAEKRRKIEELEALPTGSMGIYTPTYGNTKYMVFKDDKGRWGCFDLGVISDGNLYKITNTDDGTLLLPNTIEDAEEWRRLYVNNAEALKRAKIKDRDGDRIEFHDNMWYRLFSGEVTPRGMGRNDAASFDYFPWSINQ